MQNGTSKSDKNRIGSAYKLGRTRDTVLIRQGLFQLSKDFCWFEIMSIVPYCFRNPFKIGYMLSNAS